MRYDKAIKKRTESVKIPRKTRQRAWIISDMDVEKREIYLLHKKREVVETPKKVRS